jgi:hypothetical protein
MDYKEKYLKYKQKYLELKEQEGGIIIKNDKFLFFYNSKEAINNLATPEMKLELEKPSKSILGKQKEKWILNIGKVPLDINKTAKDAYINFDHIVKALGSNAWYIRLSDKENKIVRNIDTTKRLSAKISMAGEKAKILSDKDLLDLLKKIKTGKDIPASRDAAKAYIDRLAIDAESKRVEIILPKEDAEFNDFKSRLIDSINSQKLLRIGGLNTTKEQEASMLIEFVNKMLDKINSSVRTNFDSVMFIENVITQNIIYFNYTRGL